MTTKRTILGVMVIIVTVVVFVVIVNVNNFNANLSKMEGIAKRAAGRMGSTYVGSYGGDPWKMEHWMAVQAGSKNENIDWTVVCDDSTRDMAIVRYTVLGHDYMMVWY